jgi:hypothetical protein
MEVSMLGYVEVEKYEKDWPDGHWKLYLKCGHKTTARTRKDAMKFKKKIVFCIQCWKP